MHIYLEDTTYADAPARVLLHTTRPADPQGDTLTIELEPPLIPEKTRCTIRIHVDLDKDGAIGPGDYITTQSHSLDNPSPIHLSPVF